MFRGKHRRFRGRLDFELQEAVELDAHLMLDEHGLDRRAPDADTVQLESHAEPHVAPGGMLQAQGQLCSTTSGGVVCGWVMWTGRRSLSLSRPCNSKRHL